MKKFCHKNVRRVRIIGRASEDKTVTEARFEQCIRQMNEGDREGLREIYEEYVSYIYGIVMHMISNRENAEDITSEFFIKLWEKSALYKPGSGHRGWMATIVRNMTVDFIRKRSRETLTSQLAGMEEEQEGESGEVQRAVYTASTQNTAGAAGPGSPVEQQVVGNMFLQAALAALNEKEREVIHLKIVGELTFKEIGKILGIPQGTVAWRYREAVNKLRRCGYEQGL